jgi:hypothetical protein
MSQPGALTSIAAFFKLTARGRAPLVNTAGGFFAYLAAQCAAAWWRVIGASHAAHRGREFLAQTRGHRTSVRVHFFYAEVHTKTGATSAAAGAS